ncbi:MAG: thiamine diphosphokinase [Peptococcaceae bacterium]|jgi:thiamine pyrophosphokinase|nr:thiamine diphosphokinase [Peptococcaceae bacterium]
MGMIKDGYKYPERCVLVLGGKIEDKAMFRQRALTAGAVLAADSGAGHLLALGLMPHQVIGDMDSLSAEQLAALTAGGCHLIRVPAAKDDTDGSLALKAALRAGYGDIRIWGGLGGRPDHSYANIQLLHLALAPKYLAIYRQKGGGWAVGSGGPPEAGYSDLDAEAGERDAGDGESRLGPAVCLEDGGTRIFLPRRGQRIRGKKGDYLSFFALTPTVEGFAQRGLKYQPREGRYVSDSPFGISNEFLTDEVWVSWRAGRLLCMHIARE